MQSIIKNKISELKQICLKLDVKRLYVFGSAASGNFTIESDIDFLFSFSDKLSIKQYTENYFNLQYLLRDLFQRKIDLVTERTLSNPYFTESIDETKELIYES